MAYEYERGIIGMLEGIEDRHFIDLSDYKKELKEVYRKAKAFDEISQVYKKVTIYNTATSLEVKEILDKSEDK